MRKITLFFILTVFSFLNAQERNCGQEHAMQQLQFNPLMQGIYEQQKIQSEQEYQNLLSSKNGLQVNNTLIIPVAIHYPSSGGANATLRNCLRQLAQNQVDILNEDYNAYNADISTWDNTTSPYFPGVNKGIMNVEFEIATLNHPAGSGLLEGEPAVTFGYNFGSGSDWDSTWSGYLNIVVDNLSGGTLGYAYLASNPATGAAVFINSQAFGSGSGCTGYVPGAPYNLGRTLTHELGHYMNLSHIWGSGTCGNDFVADTPVHNTANGGCPSINHLSSCTGTPRELHMNYMDYTNDACMYMFTAGQAVRMQSHLNTIQSNFNYNTLSNENFDVNETRIALYPNPNNGLFDVTLSNNYLLNSVAVYDIAGRLVYEQNDINNDVLKIDLTSSNSGIYTVVVNSEIGIFNSKIVIK